MRVFPFICICCLFFIHPTVSQVDTSWQTAPTINISGFLDFFYVYDFNTPQTDFRQPFVFNHNRHNQFDLNLGLISLSLEHARYRGQFTLQAGTYANDNYIAEPGVMKNIYEAFMGISLNKKSTVWLEAGIFSSHIGFESAVSMDNWTLTRTLAAESSPYYLSGVKITFNPNHQWILSGIICNGWQRIQRVPGNSLLSFGTQVVYRPTPKTSINWSTFLGTDDPDVSRRIRFFNNLFGQFEFSEKFHLIAGVDYGIQEKPDNLPGSDTWWSPAIIGKYSINERWNTSLRYEYFSDQSGVIIPTNTINGFKTTGLSWNFDYVPAANVMCRIEARYFGSKDNLFQKNGTAKNSNFFIGTSIALKIKE